MNDFPRKVIHVMKVARFTLVFSIIAFASVGFGQTVKETIQGHYNEVSRLASHKAKGKLEKLIRGRMSSNFLYIDLMKNTFDAGATVRMNTEQIDSVEKFISNINEVLSYKVVGNNIVCTVKTSYEVISKDEEQHVQGVSVSEDTWTNTLAGWKLIRSKATKESLMVDGKPAKPKF